MFSADPFRSSDLYRNNWRPEEESKLAKQLSNVSRFLYGLRIQMRFGKLSRAPLQMLRLQVLSDDVECDWLARPPDPWDADLSRPIRNRHSTLQTLHDAIDARALLFSAIPAVQTAHLRVFRLSKNSEHEMIIDGYAQRNDNTSRSLHSIAMRAHILGFRFHLENDVLIKISSRKRFSSAVT